MLLAKLLALIFAMYFMYSLLDLGKKVFNLTLGSSVTMN